ncbi:hypothetical protein KL86DES1_20961 [uncultured Desulfovibrio sp.]|uniref:Uncharacterized protein n=1 Tax=uncultured Desulfovibrio sp. TaxID=167968 RepID=A0A212L629_9BACT|nr:hypothetical protein KL86DES1_20959 [uncultured Desulfovibrio sp.]SCM72989.1 hypothetical protein KL86DES1_20961 [uncultured Desulfovibrio sp.]VZH33862.1 conserved protein of unknown function [Desulfovibrio sp. 86]
MARAARLLLWELPRSARRSPCAPRNASVRLCAEWGSLAVMQATHSSLCRFSDRERADAGGGVIKNRSRHVGEVRA